MLRKQQLQSHALPTELPRVPEGDTKRVVFPIRIGVFLQSFQASDNLWRVAERERNADSLRRPSACGYTLLLKLPEIFAHAKSSVYDHCNSRFLFLVLPFVISLIIITQTNHVRAADVCIYRPRLNVPPRVRDNTAHCATHK